LRSSLSRRRRALAEHLPDAVKGDSHAVHQARVASRRLRETLPVVGADLKRAEVKKVQRRMRRLTRVLGPVRELEVALGMTEASAAADTQGGRTRVQAALRQDLDKARTRLTEALDEDKIARWLRQAQALDGALDDAIESGKTGWRAELAGRLERRANRLQAAIDEAGLLFVSDRLHEVRIALKRLRYAMELAGELRVASTAAAVRELKDVQDVLGALHDHDVLMGYAQASADQTGVDRHTRASLDALLAQLDTERHALHAQFLTHRPALSRLHERALEVAARARTHRAQAAKRTKRTERAKPAARPRRTVAAAS
jgi:CHAD domain-containing protein